MTEEAQHLINLLHELSTDGTNGPTMAQWTAAYRTRPGWPSPNAIIRVFGSWRNGNRTANLIPCNPGFRKGKKTSQAVNDVAAVDAEIKAETGWTPDAPFHLQRLAYLPSEGLPVLPPKVKTLWDWARMTHVTCEVYAVR